MIDLIKLKIIDEWKTKVCLRLGGLGWSCGPTADRHNGQTIDCSQAITGNEGNSKGQARSIDPPFSIQPQKNRNGPGCKGNHLNSKSPNPRTNNRKHRELVDGPQIQPSWKSLQHHRLQPFFYPQQKNRELSGLLRQNEHTFPRSQVNEAEHHVSRGEPKSDSSTGLEKVSDACTSAWVRSLQIRRI